MIPWDLDNSFSGAIMGFDYFNQSNIYEYDPYHYGSPGERPLAEKLLNNPTYRKQYTAHMRTIINEALDTNIIRSQINQLQNLAYNAANSDTWKAFSIAQYYSNVESALWTNWGFGGIMSTIDARKQYLLSHPEIAISPPSIYELNVTNNLVSVNAINASMLELMATTSEYNSKFKSFEMLDDGTNGDLIANDGIYSSVLPFQSSGTDIKFYIKAQNNDAMALLPERAEYEFYTYSIVSGLSDLPSNSDKKLVRITDLLGRIVTNSKSMSNIPLLYIYDDGTVDKKMIIN